MTTVWTNSHLQKTCMVFLVNFPISTYWPTVPPPLGLFSTKYQETDIYFHLWWYTDVLLGVALPPRRSGLGHGRR